LRPGGEVGSILGFFWEEFSEDASGVYHGNLRACPFASADRRPIVMERELVECCDAKRR